jgi:hypothetical protein
MGMPRTTCFAAVAAVALWLTPNAALASESDVQFWGQLSAIVPATKAVTATFEITSKQREPRVGGDQLQARGSIDVAISKKFSLGGGMTVVETAGPTELRPHQQLTLTFGNLALRTRLEERLVDGANRMGLRIRQRALLKLPLDHNDRLAPAVELLYNLRQTNPAVKPGVQEVRFTLTEQHKFSDALELGIGYLLIFAPRPGLPDRFTHAPQLTLTWRP